MANVALLGYGKMGKEVEKVLLFHQHTVQVIIENEEDWNTKLPLLLKADVAIDFSEPSAVLNNISACFKNHIPLICGTTGWYAHLPQVMEWAHKFDASFIYGSNFSIGANIFFAVNKALAQLMNDRQQYDVYIKETHHVNKKDKPSGTAITLAQQITDILDRKTDWSLSSCCKDTQLQIVSQRVDDTAGIHRVIYCSPEDEIEIKHTANNRVGFAEGAVKAALWLIRNKGIYDFNDIALNF